MNAFPASRIAKSPLVSPAIKPVAALLVLVFPAALFAQLPDVWSVTTSRTGAQQFDSVGEAEAALRALGAAESYLAATGDIGISDTQTTLHYAASPERRPVEEPTNVEYGFINTSPPCHGLSCWDPANVSYEALVPAGGWFNSQAGPVNQMVNTMTSFCGPPQSVGFLDWVPDINKPETVQSSVLVAYNPLYRNIGTDCVWNEFTGSQGEGITVRRSPQGFENCPVGYVFDSARRDCFNNATAEIFITNLTEAEDCPVGNPCLPSSGLKTQHEPDYLGTGITFERSYRSDYLSYPRRSLLGPGWSHNYESRILFDAENGEVDSLIRPDGRLVALIPNGVDGWLGVGGGVVLELVGSEYTVYLDSGGKEIYDATGVLLRTADAAGRETILTYATVGQARVLARVKGPYGHTLQFRWANKAPPLAPPIFRLTAVIDPAGNDIEYQYTGPQHVLTRVVYQDASDRDYLYEESGLPAHLTGIIDERGVRFATFDYDTRGRAVLSQHAGGFERYALAYNGDGTVTATDAREIESSYAFQAGVGAGRFVGGIERSGAVLGRVNEAAGQLRLTSETDRRGAQTVYNYDLYHVTSIIEAAGTAQARLTTYQYLNDTSDLPRFERRPSVCNDGTPRIAEVETQYVAGTQLPSATIERGFTYDPVNSVCQPIERTTQYLNYNNKGRPQVIDGPRQDVSDRINIFYNGCFAPNEFGSGCGQVALIRNAANHSWFFDTYDEHGRVTRITLPNSNVLTFAYDLRNRLTNVTETATGLPSRTTRYDYLANGLLQRATDPTGAFLEHTYNDATLLTAIRDNANNRIEYGYDLAGNRTSETIRGANGVITSTTVSTYDDFNRIDTVSLPNPNGGPDIWDYDYDAAGLLVGVASPEGKTSTYDDYDGLGRLISYVNAEDERVTYGYDSRDNIASVVAPGNVITSYRHDDFGRLIHEAGADRGNVSNEYDRADNLVATVDGRGLRTAYSYDSLNRLASIVVRSQNGVTTETLSLTYDQAARELGRVSTATALNGTLSYDYDYDGFGRLVQERLVHTGLAPVVTQRQYDAADRLSGVTRGTAAQPTLWATTNIRDVSGRITSIEDRRAAPVPIVANIVHTPFGPYSAMSFGNGRQIQRVLDQRYRLVSSQVPGVHGQTLTWGRDDNVEATTDWSYYSAWDLTVTDTRAVEYDSLDRVTRLTTLNQQIDYSYGSNGNLASWSTRAAGSGQVSETAAYSYQAGSNRLMQIASSAPWGASTATVTSDLSGNTTEPGALPRAHQYDSLSQLRVVSASDDPGDVLGRYDFNHLGERVRKVVAADGSTEITLFTYLPGGKLIGETSFTGNVLTEQRDYVWMDDTPVAMQATHFDAGGAIVQEGTYYLHADHLETPLRATDEAGVEVWEWRETQSVFGGGFASNLNGGPISPINLRFQGQYYDAEAGLNYNYYRDYDPQLGRYVQSDPIGLEGGLNTYLYANANPLTSTDPLGLFSPGAHDYILEQAFEYVLSPADIARLQRSSREFDKAHQAANESFMHSMAQEGEALAEAVRRRNEFINRTLDEARCFADAGDRNTALDLLGQAAHPIMDWSSPMHTNPNGMPRVWNPWQPLGHSPTDFIGNETIHDVTPDMLRRQSLMLNYAYRRVFGQ